MCWPWLLVWLLGAGPAAVCGRTACPSPGYTCCAEDPQAPAECCLTGFAGCYHGGGFPTGWPRYNGCNPSRCQEPRPLLCQGSRRSTCCAPPQTCGASFGVAFCRDPQCPDGRRCVKGNLCCSKPGICRSFRNVEYCAEPCQSQGQESCRLEGDHYGSEPFHLCCPSSRCRHHPDGWPFCLGLVS